MVATTLRRSNATEGNDSFLRPVGKGHDRAQRQERIEGRDDGGVRRVPRVSVVRREVKRRGPSGIVARAVAHRANGESGEITLGEVVGKSPESLTPAIGDGTRAVTRAKKCAGNRGHRVRVTTQRNSCA